MPFGSVPLQNDAMTVTLDGTGYYWPQYGTRRFNLDSVSYARTHYDAVCNTPGGSVAVWILATVINPDGSYGAWDWLPAGPLVYDWPQLIIGPWTELDEKWLTAVDVEMQAVFYGTPSASVTVYWTELQLR